MELPAYIKDDFPSFYRAMFDQQVSRQDMRAIFLEYAWDMGWCDPCAADPLSSRELRELGVFWVDDTALTPAGRSRPVPPSTQAQNVFVTRLHVRYDGAHFPEDLVFQETGDRENFQGRYVLRHPWTGADTCSAADEVPPRAADAPRRAGALAILADGMEDRRDPEAGGRAAGGGCCVVEGDLALNGGRKRRTRTRRGRGRGRRTKDGRRRIAYRGRAKAVKKAY